MIFRALILAACVAYVMCQIEYVTEATTKAPHTHRPHHHSNTTREPSEHTAFTFVYEPISHHMLLLNGHNCYIFTLTADERVAVHTDAGIKSLELKLVTLMGTGTVTAADKANLGKHVVHSCGHRTTNYFTVMQ